MCDQCFSNPHLPGCPNAPEPKGIYKCAFCGEGIIEGEYFYELDGNYYHEECIDELSRGELLEILGIYKECAED